MVLQLPQDSRMFLELFRLFLVNKQQGGIVNPFVEEAIHDSPLMAGLTRQTGEKSMQSSTLGSHADLFTGRWGIP